MQHLYQLRFTVLYCWNWKRIAQGREEKNYHRVISGIPQISEASGLCCQSQKQKKCVTYGGRGIVHPRCKHLMIWTCVSCTSQERSDKIYTLQTVTFWKRLSMPYSQWLRSAGTVVIQGSSLGPKQIKGTVADPWLWRGHEKEKSFCCQVRKKIRSSFIYTFFSSSPFPSPLFKSSGEKDAFFCENWGEKQTLDRGIVLYVHF